MPNKQPTYNPYLQTNPNEIINLKDEDALAKKAIVRRTVDYHTTIINYLETRNYYRTFREFKKIYPTTNFLKFMRPIPFEKNNESHGFCTKYVSTSVNKHKCAVNCLVWSPEGRRLITGNYMGQFTLWNGLKFNFDTILPAHKYPIRRIVWKYDSEILVSGDRGGMIKYWTANLKNLISLKCHDESINDICFSPTYLKFASVSADGYIKIWDFASFKMENMMKEHGWDVTCVDWHPFNSLIASGSKDNLVKLWSPRSGKCIKSLYGFKNTVSCVKMNKINGNWLISGSKDQLIKIWDLRMIRNTETAINGSNSLGELDKINANIGELSCLSWHPYYEKLFVCGGKSGDIKYWIVGNSNTKCEAEIHKAHDQTIWDFAWHPLGHILASSSNDQTTRFWTRNRPGDDMNDQYNVNQLIGKSRKAGLRQLALANRHNPNNNINEIDGVNLEEFINTEENNENENNENNENNQNNNNNNNNNHNMNKRNNNNNKHGNANVHPERMQQMNYDQLPGMPASYISQQQQQQPHQQYHMPQPLPYQMHTTYPHPHPHSNGPPPSHTQYPHPIPPPHHAQYPHPHGPPQPQPPPPMNHRPAYNQNQNQNQRRNDDRNRNNRNRNRGRKRKRSRSRSRSNERKGKAQKGSAVPGLNF